MMHISIILQHFTLHDLTEKKKKKKLQDVHKIEKPARRKDSAQKSSDMHVVHSPQHNATNVPMLYLWETQPVHLLSLIAYESFPNSAL